MAIEIDYRGPGNIQIALGVGTQDEPKQGGVVTDD